MIIYLSKVGTSLVYYLISVTGIIERHHERMLGMDPVRQDCSGESQKGNEPGTSNHFEEKMNNAA